MVDEAVGGWAAAHTNAEVVEALGNMVPSARSTAPPTGCRTPTWPPGRCWSASSTTTTGPPCRLNCPIKFSDDPAGIYRRPARLDEHGDEIRAELARRQPPSPAPSPTRTPRPPADSDHARGPQGVDLLGVEAQLAEDGVGVLAQARGHAAARRGWPGRRANVSGWPITAASGPGGCSTGWASPRA